MIRGNNVRAFIVMLFLVSLTGTWDLAVGEESKKTKVTKVAKS